MTYYSVPQLLQVFLKTAETPFVTLNYTLRGYLAQCILDLLNNLSGRAQGKQLSQDRFNIASRMRPFQEQPAYITRRLHSTS